MARIIKMPGADELPAGPRRQFVEELRRYYRAASRPPLRQVSKMIEGRKDMGEITASQETVRRVLRGTVVPTDWRRVNAIFTSLCEIGDINPTGDRWNEYSESNRDHLRQLWDEALEDEPDAPPVPRPDPPPQEPAAAGSGYIDDPWAAAPGDSHSGFSDEPPF